MRRVCVVVSAIAIVILAILMVLVTRTIHQVQADSRLFAAIRANDFEGVKEAIGQAANPNARAGKTKFDLITLLQEAFGRKHAEKGDTALMYAAKSDTAKDRIIQILLEKGADPNVHDDTGKTPLLLAYRFQRMTAMELLLKAGAYSNIPWDEDHPRLSIFKHAVIVGRRQSCELIIKYAKNIDAFDLEGRTMLMEAAANGDLRTVRLLISRGATIGLVSQNRDSTTAVALARHGSYSDIADFLEQTSLKK